MRFLRSEKPNIAAEGTLFSRQEIKKLLIPLIIEQFLSYLVGLADSVMVATAGNAAVSAVSLVDSISVLMVNIFAALAAGGAIVVGQYLGLCSEDQARKAGQQLLMALLVLSVLLTALLIIFEGGILHLLFGKSDVEVQENCRIYYHIVMLSVPFIALYNGAAALYRAVGNSRVPMRISMLMNVINIVGNGVLIYGFRMGVAGVAIPTLVSRGVAMAVLLILVFRPKFTLSVVAAGRYRFEKRTMGQILAMGIPNGVENGMFQLGKIVLFSLVSTLPTASITANAIGNTMANLQGVVGVSIDLGIVAVVSQCAGAGDYPQARWYIRYMVKITYIGNAIVNILLFAGMPLILKAYGAVGETARLAVGIMLIHGIFMMLVWPLAFSVNTGMRAAGDARFTMIIAVVSMWLCRVGLGHFFVLFCNTGVWGIWYAWIIDWFFRIAFFMPRYYGHKWETKSIREENY